MAGDQIVGRRDFCSSVSAKKATAKRDNHWLLHFLVASIVLLGAPSAWAQDDTFVLDRAQLSGAPDDGFMVHRPYQGDETRFYFNGALGAVMQPLRDSHFEPEQELDGAPPMVAQFPVYLSGGFQFEKIFGVNLHIPITPVQLTGAEPEEVGTAGITDRNAAMNDVRVDGRLRIWESKAATTRFGLFGGFTLDTGSNEGFGSDKQPTALAALSAEHNFGKFLLAGHVGPHFRPREQLGDEDANVGSPLYVGKELRYAIGGYLPLRNDRARLGLEIWGTTGIETIAGNSTFFGGRNTTVEWLAQGRFALSQDKRSYLNAGLGTRLSNGYGSANFRALVSIGRYFLFKKIEPKSPPAKVELVDGAAFHDTDSDGDGYPDEADACPSIKEDGKQPDPSDGCPAPKDSDKDGIPDSKDKCPNDPEDKDGIEDKDGCPEDDADHDKVKDAVDKCPTEPGPPNKDKKKNGCPTLTKVNADGMVELLRPIEFDHGKSSIKRVSNDILKEVVTLMKARPDISMSIHGHTDNAGAHDLNVKLSKARAAAVLNYLSRHGIKKSRLSSEGFGPDQPIDTNDTPEGRAHNRRVEFKIQE